MVETSLFQGTIEADEVESMPLRIQAFFLYYMSENRDLFCCLFQ